MLNILADNSVLFDNDDLKETESDKKSKLNVKSHDRLAD